MSKLCLCKGAVCCCHACCWFSPAELSPSQVFNPFYHSQLVELSYFCFCLYSTKRCTPCLKTLTFLFPQSNLSVSIRAPTAGQSEDILLKEYIGVNHLCCCLCFGPWCWVKLVVTKPTYEQMIPSTKPMATFLLIIKNFHWKCYFILIYKINLH